MEISKAVTNHSGGPCNLTISASMGLDVVEKVDAVTWITRGASSVEVKASILVESGVCSCSDAWESMVMPSLLVSDDFCYASEV